MAFGRLDKQNYMEIACGAKAVDATKAYVHKRTHLGRAGREGPKLSYQ